MSSNKLSLAKSLHHLKLSTQFKSMPENTRTSFQLQQKQSLNPPIHVDDSMDFTVDEHNAIDLYHQLSQLWEKAGMHARKWRGNSTHVLKEVPQEDLLSKVDFNHEDLPSMKTLGVVWIAETDCVYIQHQTSPQLTFL